MTQLEEVRLTFTSAIMVFSSLQLPLVCTGASSGLRPLDVRRVKVRGGRSPSLQVFTARTNHISGLYQYCFSKMTHIGLKSTSGLFVLVSILGCLLSCVRKLTEQPTLPTRPLMAQRYVQHRHPSRSPTLKWASQSLSLSHGTHQRWVVSAADEWRGQRGPSPEASFDFLCVTVQTVHGSVFKLVSCPTQSNESSTVAAYCHVLSALENIIYISREHVFCSCLGCYLLSCSLIHQMKLNSCWSLGVLCLFRLPRCQLRLSHSARRHQKIICLFFSFFFFQNWLASQT